MARSAKAIMFSIDADKIWIETIRSRPSKNPEFDQKRIEAIERGMAKLIEELDAVEVNRRTLLYQIYICQGWRESIKKYPVNPQYDKNISMYINSKIFKLEKALVA